MILTGDRSAKDLLVSDVIDPEAHGQGIAPAPRYPRVLAVTAASSFFLISAYSLRFDPAVNSGDFLAIYLPAVRRLSAAPGDVRLWVDSQYPVGYNFLILWLGRLIGFVDAGKIVSLVAATAVFVPVFGIARRMFNEEVAGWAVALLAVNRLMFRFAHYEGPDMLAVCLQLCAVWVIVRSTGTSRLAALVSGACLGGAFLMRYQTALLILIVVGFVGFTLRARPREAFRQAALVLVGAGIVAFPQLVANMWVQGRLLPAFPAIGARRSIAYASDLRTWWFANGSVFENTAASELPSRATVGRFALRQVFSDLFVLPLLPPLIGSVAWAGVLTAIAGQRSRKRPAVRLVVALMVAWIGGLSWYVFHARGMLLLVPLLTIFAAFLVWAVVRDAGDSRRWQSWAPACALGVIVLITAWLTVRPQFWPSSYDRTAVDVTAALHAAGMKTTGEVAGLTYGVLENSSSSDGDFYPVVGWDLARAHVQTWSDLRRFLCDRHFRYLVADDGADVYLFPSIGLFDSGKTPATIRQVYHSTAPQRAIAFKLLPEACELNTPSR